MSTDYIQLANNDSNDSIEETEEQLFQDKEDFVKDINYIVPNEYLQTFSSGPRDDRKSTNVGCCCCLLIYTILMICIWLYANTAEENFAALVSPRDSDGNPSHTLPSSTFRKYMRITKLKWTEFHIL